MLRVLSVLCILSLIVSCRSIADKPLNELDLKVQTTVNHCKTCHSTKEMQRGPLLEGLEDWYMEESIDRFRDRHRGMHPKDTQGLLMYSAIKDIADEDIQQAIEWFAGQKRPEIKAVIKGDIDKGKVIYKEQCYRCHEHTMGKFFSRSPDLYKLEDWYLLSQLRAYKAGWRGTEPEDKHGTSMKVAIENMNDQDFKDVTAYLATFQKKPE